MSRVKLVPMQPCPLCAEKDQKIAELKRALERHEGRLRKTLKDEGRLRANPRDTEVSAHQRTVGRTNSKRKWVYDFITSCGAIGATDDEMILAVEAMSKNINSHSRVVPRRNELETDGHIVDSGRRRKTRTGADAIVWVLPKYR